VTTDTSPTARALLALELVQGSPGMTAERLADKLGVSERAARLPPLVFSSAEALALVMAVLEQACSDHRAVRLDYRSEAGSEWLLEVDPWAVVVRHGRWYLLCRSHRADARRAYRIDRVRSVVVLDGDFTPPADLDPVAVLEQHLAVGWEYDVVIDAPVEAVGQCFPPALGRLEPIDAGSSRLVGSTSNPWWYAERLVAVPASYRIVGGPELQQTARGLGQRLLSAAGSPP
jgi:predicted DNA-binding transcriptional regulator YafY